MSHTYFSGRGEGEDTYGRWPGLCVKQECVNVGVGGGGGDEVKNMIFCLKILLQSSCTSHN